jgi:hypothetical protein
MLRRTGFAIALLLFVAATSSLAQDLNPSVTVNPAQPRVGEPVSISVGFTIAQSCYSLDDETPVTSGTTITLRLGSCPIGTPPPTPPTRYTHTWDFGPLPAGTYTVRFLFNSTVEAETSFRVVACAPDTLCLQHGQFEVKAEWAAGIGSFGTATPIQLTADTGYFWFFQPENVELLVKVIDGCFLNGHFWFFAAGLTNVETRITVTDTLLGTTQTYTNPRGTPFAPVQATSTFGCD